MTFQLALNYINALEMSPQKIKGNCLQCSLNVIVYLAQWLSYLGHPGILGVQEVLWGRGNPQYQENQVPLLGQEILELLGHLVVPEILAHQGFLWALWHLEYPLIELFHKIYLFKSKAKCSCD